MAEHPCRHIEEPRRTQILERRRDILLGECKALRGAAQMFKREKLYVFESYMRGMLEGKRRKLAEVRSFFEPERCPYGRVHHNGQLCSACTDS